MKHWVAVLVAFQPGEMAIYERYKGAAPSPNGYTDAANQNFWMSRDCPMLRKQGEKETDALWSNGYWV